MPIGAPAIASLDSLAERLVVTAVVLGVAFGVGWLAWRVGRSARKRRDRRVVNVTLGAVLLGLVLLAGSAMLAVWGSTPLVRDVGTFVEANVSNVVRVGLTLGLFAGVYVLTGLVNRLVEEVAQHRAGITEHQVQVVYRVLQVCIYGMSVLVALSFWNVDLGGLLIGAGFLGIVVGMAARQTLGALIAGFVLMFARPFEIGDWVSIGDRDGIVTDITIVNTRIQTFDGEYVMLPNDLVSSSEVINRTRKGRLRLHVSVGVDYATDLDRAIALSKEALGDVEEILTVPQPQVVLTEFGDSAVTLDLRFWIDKPSARKKWRAQTAVIRAVKNTFDEAGVKIPFPQRELMGREEAGGFRMREETAPAATGKQGTESSTPAEGEASESEGDGGSRVSPEEPPGAEDD